MSGFKRFILLVPDDAISLNIQTIDAADAKQKTIICCNNHKGKMKLTDSQVALHWLSNYAQNEKGPSS